MKFPGMSFFHTYPPWPVRFFPMPKTSAPPTAHWRTIQKREGGACSSSRCAGGGPDSESLPGHPQGILGLPLGLCHPPTTTTRPGVLRCGLGSGLRQENLVPNIGKVLNFKTRILPFSFFYDFKSKSLDNAHFLKRSAKTRRQVFLSLSFLSFLSFFFSFFLSY